MAGNTLLGPRTLGENVRIAFYAAVALGALAFAIQGGAECSGQCGPQDLAPATESPTPSILSTVPAGR